MLKILNTDLSETPHLEMQRDIFIFHCCIGCRVSDLRRLKKTDVINGGIEYIATKTIAENAGTVRVPLNATAQAIIEKYKDHSEEALLPFVYDQKYNEAIKLVLTKCEITRMVTILNSLTRKEEKKPINEIGSSHLARRTFIANLYNKVQDPNIIGSMTGHVEGSRAFSRYHTIEEKVKKDLVDILG
jgi:integrase